MFSLSPTSIIIPQKRENARQRVNVYIFFSKPIDKHFVVCYLRGEENVYPNKRQGALCC